MNLKKMITAVLERLIESYKTFIIQPSKGWFFPFRLLFIALSIFFYVFTSFVVLTVLLIVILITLPISAFSKIKKHEAFNDQ